MFVGFWQGQRVLVTGGHGFLGSFLVERLRALGCASVAAPRSAEFDLVDVDAVARVYQTTKPDIVLHLAARVGGIGANQKNPGSFFYDNLMMGVQLIEQGRRVGLKKLVALGTVCSYPKFTPVPFSEDELWNGYPEETNAPYGLAKKMLLVQSQAYRQQYGFNSVFLLPVNLYGPRDNFDLSTSHVIPALIRKCIEARDTGTPTVSIWGTGSATREFLYVEDCVEAILLAAEHYDASDPINVGSGQEISIKALAELIATITEFRGSLVWDTTKPDGQPRRRLDTSRAETVFGFKAKVGFEDGLRRTVEWYEQTRHARRASS